VCRNTLLATALAAIALFFAGRPLLRLFFTDAMLPALRPMMLLLPGVVCLSVGKVIASYLSGIGKPGYATWISSINVVLTVILDIILIPRFGIAGAAGATSIVYIVLTAASIAVFIRESGRGLVETVVPQRSDLRDYVRIVSGLRVGAGQLRL
jgi:O-antigen/teichoic acid export membrane protein